MVSKLFLMVGKELMPNSKTGSAFRGLKNVELAGGPNVHVLLTLLP